MSIKHKKHPEETEVEDELPEDMDLCWGCGTPVAVFLLRGEPGQCPACQAILDDEG